MALTLRYDDARSCSLEEFLDFVRRTVDPDDDDSVVACAPMMGRLAQNRGFFVEVLQRQLKRLASFQDTNPYVPTSFVLSRGDRYLIRANAWKPARPGDDPRVMSKLYTYGTPHDHDFSLLTAGYWGPGYETVTSTYDHRTVSGTPGERVELGPISSETLSVGKLMFYAASRDIHEQLPPDEFSVSLNLITWPRNPLPQYLFDLRGGTLVANLSNGYSNMISVIDVAGAIGDSGTACVLDEIAAVHQSSRVRVAAAAALERLREAVPL